MCDETNSLAQWWFRGGPLLKKTYMFACFPLIKLLTIQCTFAPSWELIFHVTTTEERRTMYLCSIALIIHRTYTSTCSIWRTLCCIWQRSCHDWLYNDFHTPGSKRYPFHNRRLSHCTAHTECLACLLNLYKGDRSLPRLSFPLGFTNTSVNFNTQLGVLQAYYHSVPAFMFVKCNFFLF